MVYTEAPWIFKGRALYQLQLVKSAEARNYIPPELKLVEAFGYTLGGVYLARYEDSPAGTFDECVAMAGLVWNPPTSCAWAARVFVNNREARDHGIKSVGLPSRLANLNAISHSARTTHAWWSKGAAANNNNSSNSSSGGDVVVLSNVDRGARGLPGRPVAVFNLPSIATSGFLGPKLRLSLPSFSGATLEQPSLLQYSCDLQCRVMPTAPIQIQLPTSHDWQQQQQQQQDKQKQCCGRQQQQQQHPEVLDLLLTGKPLVCLAFSDMMMRVEEPQKLLPAPSKQQQQLVPVLATVLPRK